jgi:hypothetical protein
MMIFFLYKGNDSKISIIRKKMAENLNGIANKLIDDKNS